MAIAAPPDESARVIIHLWPVRLRVLLITHFGLAVLATGASMAWQDKSFVGILFVSVLVGQSCLLGAWLALGNTSLWARTVIVFLGASCLEAQFALVLWCENGGRSGWTTMILPTALMFIAGPVFATAGPLLIARLQKARLQLITAQDPAAVSEGLQFSVRDLLLLMTLVAILLKTGQVVRGYRGGAAETAYTMIIMGLLSLCLTAPALAMVWATLGQQRPQRRMAIAMVLSLFSGLTASYFTEVSWEWDSEALWEILAAVIMVATLVGSSLLVIRSLGCRLVRAD